MADGRLQFARELGANHTGNSAKEKLEEKVDGFTQGCMAELAMECSGESEAVRSALDIVPNTGRITLTGWPKRETSLPTAAVTRKEVDISGAAYQRQWV